MKPNIDNKGRIARAITGLICICAGIVLFLMSIPASNTVRWVLVFVLVVSGIFQLFEARKGWCVARACGLKTPM